MSSPAVVLLGPQRIDPVVRGATAAPDVGVVLAELGVRRRVALITAGWQEREADDARHDLHAFRRERRRRHCHLQRRLLERLPGERVHRVRYGRRPCGLHDLCCGACPCGHRRVRLERRVRPGPARAPACPCREPAGNIQ